jgi:hypothetical protein
VALARGDRGAVTAELALSLPAVALLLAVLVGVGRVVTVQVQCVDAARAGARAAARGESAPTVVSAATSVGPDGARVSVTRNGDGVIVIVRAAAPVPLPGAGALEVSARAAAGLEWSGAGQADGRPPGTDP